MGAASNRPDGVTAAQWIDYCDHTISLTVAIQGIGDQVINDPDAPPSTVYSDLMRKAGRQLHGDTVKVRKRNERAGKLMEGLSRAALKTASEYLRTGKLEESGLSAFRGRGPARLLVRMSGAVRAWWEGLTSAQRTTIKWAPLVLVVVIVAAVFALSQDNNEGSDTNDVGLIVAGVVALGAALWYGVRWLDQEGAEETP